MLNFEEYMKETHPGIFVHRIYIEENPDADLRADYVCICILSPITLEKR